ncbi:MAG: TIGR03862 family flavoprotein [Comamonadaceae bacterium]
MKNVLVVGAGPAGLMAAEVLSSAGVAVHLYDTMPSVGRKFLLAGKGGLNLTHSEPTGLFVSRYGKRQQELASLLSDFDNSAVRAWAATLGIETFVGTSGRVFPADMKAAPLLRAWLQRLRHPLTGPAVQFHMRHRWTALDASSSVSGPASLSFDGPQGPLKVQADAVVLALGGGSWKRLGSDGAWVPLLTAQRVAVAPLLPSNCGFDVGTAVRAEHAQAGRGWSQHFASRFAGQPFKSVAIAFNNSQGTRFARQGEFIATASGVEGSLIYAASSLLRDEIMAHGSATLALDLLPALSPQRVLSEVVHPRGSRTLSNHLKSRLGIEGVKAAILYELLGKEQLHDPVQLAAAIKALPITLVATRPLDEAISSAGGVLFEAMTEHLMLKALPGVFCAGEMLDWEAPTGGYLLTACLASGRRAARGVLAYLG